MVRVESITSTTVTIEWSFPQSSQLRDEVVTIYYGTTKDVELVTDPVPTYPDMQQYSVQLTSLQPDTRYYFQIYSSNEFNERTDGVDYVFMTNDDGK